MHRILVVDDDIEICSVLEDFLNLKGYAVYTASNGENAVRQVKEVKPHIILLDVAMPGIDGIETLQEIKKVDPAVGVIMITSVVDEELARRAIASGAYEYITKPLDFHYLEIVLLVKIIDLLA